MNKRQIILYFISWRILLCITLAFSISILALRFDFLGGGLVEYLKRPNLWAFINFDGEHYLSISYRGYQPLTYFYFPLYPLVVKYFAEIFAKATYFQLAVTGVVISNIAFLLSLYFFYKLLIIDYKKGVSKRALILLILFPTSFYFASFYTESIFFLISILSFYMARKRKWLLASILGALLSLTRLAGVIMFFVIIAEIYSQQQNKAIKVKKTYYLYPFIVLLGTLSYLYFLYMRTSDPLIFVKTVEIFGQQRSSQLIILPQVFYRYIFKILPNINYNYFPVVFTTLLEFGMALLFLIFSIYSFLKLRLSYSIYFLLSYILPTLSGSFSSLPRYVLVIFPFYILVSQLLGKSKSITLIWYLVSLILLVLSSALFFRGYWVS